MIVVLKITDEHRSLIATAFVAAYDHAIGNEENKRRSLCCAPDGLAACAVIVGEMHAEKLHSFFYEGLGCCGWRNPEHQESEEQYFLDKIANLEDLTVTINDRETAPDSSDGGRRADVPPVQRRRRVHTVNPVALRGRVARPRRRRRDHALE